MSIHHGCVSAVAKRITNRVAMGLQACSAMQLSRLDDLSGKLQSLETKLDEFAADHLDIVRLMTIPIRHAS